MFAAALTHWAEAAYAVGGSPCEMKRFLNRLRFAAAGSDPEQLRGDVIVGLGVLTHANEGALRAFAYSGDNLRNAVEDSAEADPVMAMIRDAITFLDDPANSDLPKFAPTQEQAERFLALWDGVVVRA